LLTPSISDDEQASQLIPHVKRRAHALILFTAAAFEGSSLSSPDTDPGGLNKLVSALLEISSSQNIPDIAEAHGSLVEIAQAASFALSECTRSMSAMHFVASIANILKEGRPDERVSRGVLAETLDVFVDRLPSVSKSTREGASPTIKALVTEIKRLLPLGDEKLAVSTLRAIKAIGLSIVPGEEGSLVDCLPLILTASKTNQLTSAAVATLPPLWYVLSDIPLGITL
jgi:U3 small nucleolar RNA-associated protein 10